MTTKTWNFTSLIGWEQTTWPYGVGEDDEDHVDGNDEKYDENDEDDEVDEFDKDGEDDEDDEDDEDGEFDLMKMMKYEDDEVDDDDEEPAPPKNSPFHENHLKNQWKCDPNWVTCGTNFLNWVTKWVTKSLSCKSRIWLVESKPRDRTING